MTSPSPRGQYEHLPHHVTAGGLPAHYRAVRQRLMERKRDYLTVSSDLSPVCVKAEEQIKDLSARQSLTQAQQILSEVSRKHGVSIPVIRGPRRTKEAVAARHEYCVRLYSEMPQLSLPSIGRLINRDHTTVLYAVRKHKEAMGE